MDRWCPSISTSSRSVAKTWLVRMAWNLAWLVESLKTRASFFCRISLRAASTAWGVAV
ncbi:MAG: hypothetical protein M5U09_26665 [Gammaproteobacteria bacterium]|nr:hypothetical protein [Gammaproteobacteria bacterium]